jgi:hypothetical protein
MYQLHTFGGAILVCWYTTVTYTRCKYAQYMLPVGDIVYRLVWLCYVYIFVVKRGKVVAVT